MSQTECETVCINPPGQGKQVQINSYSHTMSCQVVAIYRKSKVQRVVISCRHATGTIMNPVNVVRFGIVDVLEIRIDLKVGKVVSRHAKVLTQILAKSPHLQLNNSHECRHRLHHSRIYQLSDVSFYYIFVFKKVHFLFSSTSRQRRFNMSTDSRRWPMQSV